MPQRSKPAAKKSVQRSTKSSATKNPATKKRATTKGKKAGTMTPAEARTFILNVDPSPVSSRDWQFEHARDAGVLPRPRGPIPPSTDLRQPWWSIGNQGPTGSCVGWATADGVVRWHMVKSGKLAATTDDRLSPRFVWMASKETDSFNSRPETFIEASGTQLKAALEVVKKWGAVSEASLPFDGKLFGGKPEEFFAAAAQRRIASYFSLGVDVKKWREWIALKGPVLARIVVDQAWYDATTNAGLIDAAKPLPPGQGGGHAVVLVGYTSDRIIVRNSWGTGWGDQGFASCKDAYLKAVCTESYGISV